MSPSQADCRPQAGQLFEPSQADELWPGTLQSGYAAAAAAAVICQRCPAGSDSQSWGLKCQHLAKSVAWDLLRVLHREKNSTFRQPCCKPSGAVAGVRTCVGVGNTCTCQTSVVLEKPKIPEGLGAGVRASSFRCLDFFLFVFPLWWFEIRG